MNKSNTLVDEYQDMKTDVRHLLDMYEQKLNQLDTIGLGLHARVISSVAMFRECDDRFFEKTNPDDYLTALFDKQFKYLDMMDALTKRLGIKDQLTEKASVSDDAARDALHKDLFNQTWHTLKMSGDPFNDYRPYIELIEKRLKNNNLDESFFTGKRTLDVGCGTGRFSFCMAGLGAEAYGIDPGQTSISQAQQLATSMKLNNTHFSVGNAYSLDFTDETFDFVVCNGVLHHLDEQDKALEEIYRVMKKDGLFWLYIEGSGGIYHDMWSLICRSFNGIPLSHVIDAINELRIPNLHFWMDMFFAKYNLISWEDNLARMERIGFTDIKRMHGAELIDLDIQMFTDDPYARIKFGDGGLRMLIRK